MDKISGSIKSAAYFWAARSNDEVGFFGNDKDSSSDFLKEASQYSQTFYGLLAAHALGDNVSYRWKELDLEDEHTENIKNYPAGGRAIALLQMGRTQAAQRELYNLFLSNKDDDDLLHSIIAFAQNYNLPNLQLRLGQDNSEDSVGKLYDAICYPAPVWQPRDGWKVDKALIYAIIRQESHFNNLAKSKKGASGLMQLMPATASLIANDRNLLRRKTNLLFEPEYNLSIGQAYIRNLMGYEAIRDNLFLVLASYNAGPGNALKWYKKFDHSDPLLFMETIPMGETKNYTQRVLANYWAYSDRFGSSNSTLDDLLKNRWPTIE
jgi:soluble lytic murein transglycosylase-like protein